VLIFFKLQRVQCIASQQQQRKPGSDVFRACSNATLETTGSGWGGAEVVQMGLIILMLQGGNSLDDRMSEEDQQELLQVVQRILIK